MVASADDLGEPTGRGSAWLKERGVYRRVAACLPLGHNPVASERTGGERRRKMRRLIVMAAVAMLSLGVLAAPASATVHEIVGQWCSGRGELFPPGISGGSNADNMAQPLFASGFASIVDPFDPDGPGGADEGVLVAFDFDHPAAKIVGLGFFVQIDTLPDGRPLYIEAFDLDTSDGFTNCARLSN